VRTTQITGLDTQAQGVHVIGKLRQWDKHHRARCAVQASISGVDDHANDLTLGLVRKLPHETSTDDELIVQWFRSRPKLSRHSLVDHGHWRRRRIVAIRERSAAQQTNAESSKEPADVGRQPLEPCADRRMGD
jgi:hypothetical protein